MLSATPHQPRPYIPAHLLRRRIVVGNVGGWRRREGGARLHRHQGAPAARRCGMAACIDAAQHDWAAGEAPGARQRQAGGGAPGAGRLCSCCPLQHNPHIARLRLTGSAGFLGSSATFCAAERGNCGCSAPPLAIQAQSDHRRQPTRRRRAAASCPCGGRHGVVQLAVPTHRP